MNVPLPSANVRLGVAAALGGTFAVVLMIDQGACLALLRFCYNMFDVLFAGGSAVAFHLLLVLLSGWLAVRVGVAVIREVVQRRRWTRLLRRSLRTESPDRREVVVASRESFAFTVGWLAPTSYISTAFLAHLSADEQDAVRAHERAHRDRRDPLRLFLWDLLAAVVPFFPVVRQFARAAATDYESAADRAAATSGTTRQSLLSAIAVSVRVGGTLPGHAVVHFALNADLLSRLKRLHGERDACRIPLRSVVVTAVSVAALLLPALVIRTNAKTMDHMLQCVAPESAAPAIPMSSSPKRLRVPPGAQAQLIMDGPVSYPQGRP